MPYETKLWTDRRSDFPLRRELTDTETGKTATVDVTRAEGMVQQEGNQFSAHEMNNLEGRISDAFTEVREQTPIRSGTFTLRESDWVQYNSAGKTLYRQSVTGLNANPTDRLDITAGIETVDDLYSSLIPVNNNGTLYVTTAVKPTFTFAVQVFLTPTRGLT